MDKKHLVRLANSSHIRASENTLRNLRSTIYVYYGANWSYFENLETIISLAAEVKKEFPSVSDKEISVQYVTLNNAGRLATITVLQLAVSVDEFLQLRKNFRMYSL